jgi:hypothetical protein
LKQSRGTGTGKWIFGFRRAGQPVRALARATANPERLESLRQADAEIVLGDLSILGLHLAELVGAIRFSQLPLVGVKWT